MDNFDIFAALKGAGGATADRIKNLNAYAALYDKMGMGGANPTGQVTSGFGFGGMGGYNNPQLSQGQQSRNAMDWATNQLNQDTIQQQRAMPPPDFFGPIQSAPQPEGGSNYLKTMMRRPMTIGVRG